MTIVGYLPYAEYKLLADHWQSAFPSHWGSKPLKHLCRFHGGGTPSKDIEGYWHGDIPWVSPKDMKRKFIDSSQDRITAEAVDGSSTKLIDEGALLMVVRSGILRHSIPVAINTKKVTLNQDMKALVFGGEMITEYVFYYIKGSQSDLLQAWSKQGATVESIEQEYLVNSIFPTPPVNEQRSIVNFLDHETAKIDTLIDKQHQLIKLLKEKRQAVISHAVTKGLNPDATMKDSGVEWLGEVPEHWVVARYKFCTSRIVVGIAEAATHAYADTGVPIIRSTNIGEDGLRTFDLLFIKEAFAEQNESKYLYANDVVTVRTGFPGISSVIPEGLNKSQCFTNLIATPLKDHLPEFLSEYLNSHTGKSYFNLLGWGSAQKNISVPILQNIPIAYPPQAEQEDIVEYVGKQRRRFDDLIAKASLSIELMKERRTVLISAAVTGKIDVRNWQPKQSDIPMEASA